MPLEADMAAIERFLEEEVAFLDAGDLDGWVNLCTDDAIYWMPVSAQQTDPLGEISILYENRTLMDLRRFNYGHRLAPSFETALVCSHLQGRPRLLDTTEEEIRVRNKFHCVMWYREEQRLFAGHATYHLVPAGKSYRIRMKRVDLVNAEAAHRSIPIYL